MKIVVFSYLQTTFFFEIRPYRAEPLWINSRIKIDREFEDGARKGVERKEMLFQAESCFYLATEFVSQVCTCGNVSSTYAPVNSSFAHHQLTPLILQLIYECWSVRQEKALCQQSQLCSISIHKNFTTVTKENIKVPELTGSANFD